MRKAPDVDAIEARAYRVPTETSPESDGTLEWSATTLVVVLASSGSTRGLGYTYAHRSVGLLIEDLLADVVTGRSALAPPAAWEAMRHETRNLMRRGLTSMAIAAVDTALWDLHARLLDVPLHVALGAHRDRVPAYGSGGFTSESETELARQLASWADLGLRWVKMKVGRDPDNDPDRVDAARAAIGPDVGLFVDANGAYTAKQALDLGWRFADAGVTWFEEPVSSEDLDGLRLLRQRLPSPIEVAAGEYVSAVVDARRILDADAVDTLQLDATRIGGFTPFLRAAALAESRGLPLSAHTAPALHVSVCCAAPRVAHLEFFQDHVRIEGLAFDGLPALEHGDLVPNDTAPGNGLDLRAADLAPYRVPLGGDR